MFSEILYTILTTTISSSILLLIKSFFDKKESKAEEKEIENKLKTVEESIGVDDDIDIMKLMFSNLKELREYYVISKRQANKTFSASIFVCFLGVVIYSLGIVFTCLLNQDISLISIISGTTVEIISALFFWMYSKSMSQLNIYHKRLSETEKYLITIQLVERISKESLDSELHFIIESILKNSIN